jgi:sodium pump decarboxylase gamma subunit
MKKSISLVMLALVLATLGGFAHNRKALRLNEVMVCNQESVVDDYGQHSAWIELFNANFAPLEISSVYLSTNPANPKMYPVPLGDEKTKVGKRQHVVFWADGQHDKGTFHTNFTLTPGQDNWIGLFDADGSLIDSITVPAALGVDQSFAREDDGVGAWSIRVPSTDNEPPYITPSASNIIKGSNPKIEEFAENDANGFAMTIMAMCIVFSALLMLCLSFYAIGEISKRISRSKKAQAQGKVTREEVLTTEQDSGEEIAAIVLALHEHLNAHDNESTILTIDKVKRAYSPWNSKLYGLRQMPRH